VRRRAAWGPGLLGLAVLAACSAGEGAPDGALAVGQASAPPERFAFGTAADPARIALWDVDVRPDGTGLPEGSGTVEAGAAVYRATCAGCHGAEGEGGAATRLVDTRPWEDWPASRSVGNYWPYATTLFDYIVRAMPQNAPGSLSADETYAVIAYVLHLNGIVPADAVMSRTTLPAVVMPARDRFVPDNRLESNRVK
jgi:S-disulfanyl-L-cysteine oxidoreductase SoxD